MKITSLEQPQAVPALHPTLQQILPAVESKLTLQPCSYSFLDEEAGHFSLWAKNEYTDGWRALGFWVVYRKDGVGPYTERETGRADMGWQL
jgi:hypothetical protein